MSKLLSANLARLWKNKVFWMGMMMMAMTAAGICIDHYRWMREVGDGYSLDSFLFGYALLAGIAASVVSSLFLGTEYSDGTIRNKIIAGHTKGTVYLANLITVFLSIFFLCLAYIAAACLLGVPLLGMLVLNGKFILLLCLNSVMIIAAYSAIYTMISMLVSNRAFSSVIYVFLTFSLLILAVNIDSQLREPEFWEGWEGTRIVYSEDPLGTVPEKTEELKGYNPNYLQRGTKRQIYEFLYDFIPFGQALQTAELYDIATDYKEPWYLSLYSLLIVVAATGSGIYFFQRKDLN